MDLDQLFEPHVPGWIELEKRRVLEVQIPNLLKVGGVLLLCVTQTQKLLVERRCPSYAFLQKDPLTPVLFQRSEKHSLSAQDMFLICRANLHQFKVQQLPCTPAHSSFTPPISALLPSLYPCLSLVSFGVFPLQLLPRCSSPDNISRFLQSLLCEPLSSYTQANFREVAAALEISADKRKTKLNSFFELLETNKCDDCSPSMLRLSYNALTLYCCCRRCFGLALLTPGMLSACCASAVFE